MTQEFTPSERVNLIISEIASQYVWRTVHAKETDTLAALRVELVEIGQLANVLDDAFGIEVIGEDMMQWKTVQDVIDTVERRIKQKEASNGSQQ